MGRRALSNEEIDELLHELASASGYPDAPSGSLHLGEASEPLARPHEARRGVRLVEEGADLPPASHEEPRRAPNADSLVAILQQALDELHLHDEPAEGARFLLRLARWAIHAQSGWVLLFDASTKHFIVLAGLGPEAVALEGMRIAAGDPLLAEAMETQTTTIINQPTADRRVQSERFARVGAERSILCAPAMSQTSCTGAIELVDPVNFSEFAQGHLRAASLLASALAAYLSERIDSEDEGTGPRRRRP